MPVFAMPAAALEGGTPLTAGAVSRGTVAIQAVAPQPDGTARVSECTGVLVAPDRVLTAAHCLDEASAPQHVAVFFFDGPKAVPPYAPVAAILRHPGHVKGWARRKGNIETRQTEISSDLAVLRLASPAPAGRAPLPLGGTGRPDILTVLGAGMDGPDGRSGTLKSAPLGNIRHTRSGPQLAFATPGRARICRGDSGGPVLGPDGKIWGISGAILRGEGGCSGRAVVVPVNTGDPAIRTLLDAR